VDFLRAQPKRSIAPHFTISARKEHLPTLMSDLAAAEFTAARKSLGPPLPTVYNRGKASMFQVVKTMLRSPLDARQLPRV
jgi:hypothetical protein